MRLGIVGHEAAKFTTVTALRAREAILAAIDRHGATVIISGRSPLGGIDAWAEDLAEVRGLPTCIFPAEVNRWDGGDRVGFKQRNLQIAHESDLMLVVVVRELPPGFEGPRYESCYHCKDRTPPHVKSGGCWTAWRCPQREWVIL